MTDFLVFAKLLLDVITGARSLKAVMYGFSCNVEVDNPFLAEGDPDRNTTFLAELVLVNSGKEVLHVFEMGIYLKEHRFEWQNHYHSFRGSYLSEETPAFSIKPNELKGIEIVLGLEDYHAAMLSLGIYLKIQGEKFLCVKNQNIRNAFEVWADKLPPERYVALFEGDA